MEYKELRIGNYIQIKCVSDEIGITDDWSNQELNVFSMKGLMFGNKDFEFKPIPITEEWLLKFGFQLMTKRSCKYMMKDRHDEPCFFFCKNKVRYQNTYIKHLHQLQNLYFALKGEELIIKE